MKRILTIITMGCFITGTGVVAHGSVNNMDPKSILISNGEVNMESITIVGTIMLKGGSWVIYGTDSQNGEAQDYYPKNLKQAYKIEGQKVIVEAKLDPIASNIRYVGAPITIIRIDLI